MIYQGDASDEALERVWDKVPEAEGSFEVQLSYPDDGQEIPAGPAPLFTWENTSASLPGGVPRRVPLPAGGELAPRATPPTTFEVPSLGFAEALAHLPPVTGWVYLVEFRASSTETDPLRVFTTETSWEPGVAEWSRLGSAAGAITVTLWSAYLNQNVIETGPLKSGSTTFTIANP